MVTRLAAALREEFSIQIPIAVLFQITCVADLAKYIKLSQLKQEETAELEVFDL
jgi:acyl carrier protein